MWLERFGNVDQNIFFGFCAVVFVILVINCAIFITRIFNTLPAVPGHSLTFFNMMSSMMISVSVLHRGTQPAWTTSPIDTLQGICQVFTVSLVLGYTLYSAALFVRIWMLLLALRWEKNTVEWLGHFVLWVILVIAAVMVIIWEVSFPPNVHPAAADNSSEANASTSVYECRGLLEDGSRDIEQYAWRLAMTCYVAVFLLLAVTALPFYACVPMYDKRSRWVKVNVISVVLVTINALCCVIVGLIVWYRYNPTPLRTNDNNKYAIIGALQLWMILVTVAAVLFTELVTLRSSVDVNGIQKQSFSSNYSANKRELTSYEADVRPDIVSDRHDDLGEAPARSSYSSAVDDYDGLETTDKQSSDTDHADTTAQIEIDSGRRTSVDPVDDGTDTEQNNNRASVDADITDSPLFY